MLAVNALTTLVYLKANLKINDTSEDVVLEGLINAASDNIEQYCNRNFKTIQHTQKIIWNREKYINLKNFPVVSIESFKVDDVDFEDYSINNENGVVKLNKILLDESAIEIEYTAGLSVIPAALEQACVLYAMLLRGEMNMLARAGNENAGIKREKIGDYDGEFYQLPIQSLTKLGGQDGSLPDVIKNLIKPYVGRV